MQKCIGWVFLVIAAVVFGIGMAKALPVAETDAMAWVFGGTLIGICGFFVFLDSACSSPRANRRV